MIFPVQYWISTWNRPRMGNKPICRYH